MDGAQAVVEALVAAGESFAAIEEYIEELVGFSGEQKSALWLLAWGELQSPERRRLTA